jgi:hypothetical protein
MQPLVLSSKKRYRPQELASGWKPANASAGRYHAASIGLAVATPPTRLASEPMVPGSS